MLYHFMLYWFSQISSVTDSLSHWVKVCLCPADRICATFPFFKPICSFDWPFHLTTGGMYVENHLTLCRLNDWQSYQRNRKEKKNPQRPKETAAGGDPWCPWHAWNSKPQVSNFSVQDAVPRTRWHFWAISCLWARFMQHSTIWEAALG